MSPSIDQLGAGVFHTVCAAERIFQEATALAFVVNADNGVAVHVCDQGQDVVELWATLSTLFDRRGLRLVPKGGRS